MVELLHLTMELTEHPDGSYEARCPELAVSATGRHAGEAIESLRELVFSSLSDGFDCSFGEIDSAESLRSLLTTFTHCWLHIPRDPLVN